MMAIKRNILLLVMLLTTAVVMAQEVDAEAVRPVTNVLQLQMGRVSARDTYLTPQLYSGINMGVQYERWHAWKNPLWVSEQTVVARFGMPEDRGGHSSEWVGRFGYRYAAHHRWEHVLWEPLTLLGGAFAGVEGGFDYNLKMEGANNPATVKMAVNTGVSAAAIWYYKLFGKPSSAMLHMQLPLIGLALQPEYGASYYETFYLKTAGNETHFTSLHNRQDLDVRLTTDMALSAIPWLKNNGNRLRLGVGYHIETMDINQVVTRYSTCECIVGVVFDVMKYNRQKTNLLKRQTYEAY